MTVLGSAGPDTHRDAAAHRRISPARRRVAPPSPHGGHGEQNPSPPSHQRESARAAAHLFPPPTGLVAAAHRFRRSAGRPVWLPQDFARRIGPPPHRSGAQHLTVTGVRVCGGEWVRGVWERSRSLPPPPLPLPLSAQHPPNALGKPHTKPPALFPAAYLAPAD